MKSKLSVVRLSRLLNTPDEPLSVMRAWWPPEKRRPTLPTACCADDCDDSPWTAARLLLPAPPQKESSWFDVRSMERAIRASLPGSVKETTAGRLCFPGAAAASRPAMAAMAAAVLADPSGPPALACDPARLGASGRAPAGTPPGGAPAPAAAPCALPSRALLCDAWRMFEATDPVVPRAARKGLWPGVEAEAAEARAPAFTLR